MGSNRSFGLVFFMFFFIISIWPLTYAGQIRVWSLIIATIFFILGLMKSNLLTPLNLRWTKIGIFLGGIIAPFIMGLVFFLVVTPTSFIMKIFGRDLLKRKYHKNKKSYWIIREKNKSTMKQQF